MEKSLEDRDRVGVQDAVLLENYTSEKAFVDNLEKRFKENIIYVSPNACHQFHISLFFFFLIFLDIYRTSTDFGKSL